MDFKTETQLRNELAEAWRMVDRHKMASEVYAAERDHARASKDRTIKILVGIHALLYPPRFTTPDGAVMEFRSPIVKEQMQALSDRIRALPDEIAPTYAEMKAHPWKSIESAPLDTRVLLWWRPVDGDVKRMTPVIGEISSHDPGHWWNGGSLQAIWHVTHWMPLPPGPEGGMP